MSDFIQILSGRQIQAERTETITGQQDCSTENIDSLTLWQMTAGGLVYIYYGDNEGIGSRCVSRRGKAGDQGLLQSSWV